VARLDELQTRLRPLRSALLDHALYRHIDSLDALRLFLAHHVFAVWDFMSLLKALQRHLCCVTVPWRPSAHPLACRIINEVVLSEESDVDGKGGYASHFALYHRAMSRCGADTSGIDRFLTVLQERMPVRDAITRSEVPVASRRFVLRTFTLLEADNPCAIAAAFALGREDLLPDLFRQVVDALNVEIRGNLDDFRYYLDRHIGLDGDEHGPMALKLVELLCGNDERHWQLASEAAEESMKARLELWDGILAAITQASSPVDRS
jgi:Protein of unknown function (DUF3050)